MSTQVWSIEERQFKGSGPRPRSLKAKDLPSQAPCHFNVSVVSTVHQGATTTPLPLAMQLFVSFDSTLTFVSSAHASRK